MAEREAIENAARPRSGRQSQRRVSLYVQLIPLTPDDYLRSALKEYERG